MASRRYDELRVLIVEDEMHVVTRLRERLNHLKPGIHIVIAGSRSSGIEALRGHEFDFIVCDLRLPPNDGGVDTDEAHGLAVHAEVRSICPGTPCLFFTGFGTSQNVLEQLSSGGTHDVLGTSEPYAMTRLLTKDKFLTCVERLESFNSELAILDTISVELSSSKVGLDRFDRRSLQLLGRPLGGTSIEASALGGLSGAQALRAVVKDDRGHALGSYFTKIDLRTKLKKERENYHRYVSPLLKMGHFPALERDIEAGIGKREALFYQLADEYTKSLFEVLEVSENDAIAVVEVLRDILAPWTEVREEKTLRIRDLRMERIDDSVFQPFRGVLGSTETFEEIEQDMTTSCQHGDLHGFNVLCSVSGGAVLIDFGNVGPAPICTDPIILELSVLFHKDSPFRNNPWPTNEQAEAWFHLEEYLVGCPVPEFIRECRQWANETSGPAGLPPVVYTEAVRQLKYEDANRERAWGIARAAMRMAV